VISRHAIARLVTLAPTVLAGCGGPNLTAEQWQAIETRPVDGARDDVLRAAAAVMLDEGFMYTLSDSTAGLLAGERLAGSANADYYARSGGMRLRDGGPLVERVTFWVRAVAPDRCEIRTQFLDTAGQRTSSEERVTQIWTYVQQRMLKYTPPRPPASSTGGRP
jgi:hypothetical protein